MADMMRGSAMEFAVPEWRQHDRMYQCKVRLCPDEAGRFFVVALNLPGVVSQGNSPDEAIANIREACAGAIESYLERTGAIPWGPVDAEDCAGSKEFWVSVNA